MMIPQLGKTLRPLFIPHPKLKRNTGFTLAEVLVSILITGAFTVAAMQALIIGAALQAEAKKFSEATNWIQEDLERIKIVAYDTCQTRYAERKLSADAASGATTLTLAYLVSGDSEYSNAQPPGSCPFTSVTDGFRVGDQLLIGSDSTNNTITAISGSQVTLAAGLGSARFAGARVYARCRAGASTGGYGAYVQSLLPTMVSNGSKVIVNSTYTMTRTATVRNASPFEILELNYRVQDSNNNIVAQVSTEVVPNAFFRCP